MKNRLLSKGNNSDMGILSPFLPVIILKKHWEQLLSLKIERTLLKFMLHLLLKYENKLLKSKICQPCLAHRDYTNSEAKLTVKFYTL